MAAAGTFRGSVGPKVISAYPLASSIQAGSGIDATKTNPPSGKGIDGGYIYEENGVGDDYNRASRAAKIADAPRFTCKCSVQRATMASLGHSPSRIITIMLILSLPNQWFDPIGIQN